MEQILKLLEIMLPIFLKEAAKYIINSTKAQKNKDIDNKINIHINIRIKDK